MKKAYPNSWEYTLMATQSKKKMKMATTCPSELSNFSKKYQNFQFKKSPFVKPLPKAVLITSVIKKRNFRSRSCSTISISAIKVKMDLHINSENMMLKNDCFIIMKKII